MVVDAIDRFFAQPVIANALNRFAHARQTGFNNSIDGLVLGVALGILSSIVYAFNGSRDPDEYALVKYFIYGAVTFGAIVVVSTVAFGIIGFAKGMMG